MIKANSAPRSARSSHIQQASVEEMFNSQWYKEEHVLSIGLLTALHTHFPQAHSPFPLHSTSSVALGELQDNNMVTLQM